MLITILTSTLSTADKQLLTAAFEQSNAIVSIACLGDGVYAPGVDAVFFESLTTFMNNNPQLNVFFLSSDAVSRGVNLPAQITPISNKELAALSARNTQWVTLS